MKENKVEFAVGDAVIAATDIWDNGEDHHPPGYLAKKGERLYIRKILGNNCSFAVSHENVINSSFVAYPKEIKQL